MTYLITAGMGFFLWFLFQALSAGFIFYKYRNYEGAVLVVRKNWIYFVWKEVKVFSQKELDYIRAEKGSAPKEFIYELYMLQAEHIHYKNCIVIVPMLYDACSLEFFVKKVEGSL